MVVAWAAGPSAKAADGRLGLETRWWQTLVVLLALACMWELFGLEGWLGNWARAMAHAEDFYYPRAVLQKVVISVAVAATVLLLPFIRRARSSHRLVLVSFGLYLAIAAVNLVSLHTIDKVADLSWHGVNLVQALKFVCAAMTLLGVGRLRRSRVGGMTMMIRSSETCALPSSGKGVWLVSAAQSWHGLCTLFSQLWNERLRVCHLQSDRCGNQA